MNLQLTQLRDVRLEIEASLEQIVKVKDREDCVQVLLVLSKEIPVEIPQRISL